MSPPATVHSVCSSLKASLSRTLSDIPFLTGSFEPEDHNQASGRLSIITSRTGGVAFHTREVVDRFPCSYADFKRNGYPIKDLDPDLLAPVDVVAIGPSPPVMVVQANFVVGGLLLVVCVHHAAMDASGLNVVLDLWSKHSQDVDSDFPFEPKVLPEFLNRSGLMPNGNRVVSRGAHPQYAFLNRREDSETPEAEGIPILPFPDMTSKVFRFMPAQLFTLKTDAMPVDPADGWISTHDAVCALLWKAIVAAREAQQVSGEPQSSTLSFAVDGRRKVSPALPTAYLGNMNIYTSVTRRLSSILSTELCTLALEIRQAINGLGDGQVRDIIELLASAPVVTEVHTGGKHFLGKDLSISSWAALTLHGLDWGPTVGKVERVRVPYASFDGLCIVLPRLEDGSLEVVIGLKEEHMEWLIQSAGEFGRFAKVIG